MTRLVIESGTLHIEETAMGRRLQIHKYFLLILNCILVVSLLLTGCGGGAVVEEEEEEGAILSGEEVDTPIVLQEGNTLSKIQFDSNKSKELADNRMGCMFTLREDVENQEQADFWVDFNNDVGYKRTRLSLDYFDWSEIEETGAFSRFYIDPVQDRLITDLTDNGMKILYCLVFWDEEIKRVDRGYARFKTDEEIARYLEYVRFIVQHFKDRIEYYEILNESFFGEESHFTQQNIALSDYINLIKRVVPVIREEYPEAKIVAGPAPGIIRQDIRNYFFGIIESEIMPLVDAIAWHPGPYSLEYDDLKDYCSEYPSIVERIMDTASSHGFEGEYIVEELQWRIQGAVYEPWTFSEIVAAKYYGRGIVMHLGMNITTGLAGGSHELDIPRMRVIRNLCTIMAGADPTTIPVEIESEVIKIRSYGFSLPNGDELLALWTDGIAVDDDPGVSSAVIFSSNNYQKVVAIDILNSFQQELIASDDNGNLVVENLLVKDYPLILRLIP